MRIRTRAAVKWNGLLGGEPLVCHSGSSSDHFRWRPHSQSRTQPLTLLARVFDYLVISR